MSEEYKRGSERKMREEFYYPSRDGVTQIHAISWKPDGEVKAILQISHGMVEHIGRYEEFAQYMNELGFYVVGNDHLGHGESVQSEEYYGYFHEEKGNAFVIGDIHKLRTMTTKKYPDTPYFMLGHSMGSFLLRQYLTMYGKGLAGAVIIGTGYWPLPALFFGTMLCRSIAAFKGWKYHSKLLVNITTGNYAKHFKTGARGNDWLSSDEQMRKSYNDDPFCDFTFTVNAYYQMFLGMKILAKREKKQMFPVDLPVFIASGTDDPVGNFGKGVKKVHEIYKRAKVKDLQIKLYEKARHEILNERNRETVYKDIGNWLTSRL